MNPIKTTLLLLVLVMLSSLMPNRKLDLKMTSSREFETSAIATDDVLWSNDECFDQKMDTWFIAFNHYQSMGYDMNKANEMAVAEADGEYHGCNGDMSAQMASVENDLQSDL